MILKCVKDRGEFNGIHVVKGVNTTHLLFTDDGPLFGNGTLSKENAIWRYLSLYHTTTNMLLSQQKSTTTFCKLEVPVVQRMKETLTFQIQYFEDNVKYIAYKLKEKYYTSMGRLWLYEKD